MAEEAKALCSEPVSNAGSSSGRLGAAVQRAMAIRERQSSQVVEGIGSIRQILLYEGPSLRHSRPQACSQCGGSLNMNLWLDYCADGGMVAASGRKTQSMRYSRISNDDGFYDTEYAFSGNGRMAVEDPNDKNGPICSKTPEKRSTEAETKARIDSGCVLSGEKHHICEACRSVRELALQCHRMNDDDVHVADPHRSRKGFVRRLCSRILKLHRKSPAAAIF